MSRCTAPSTISKAFFAEFVFEQWAHKIPMIGGAMTTRNFEEIRELLQGGTRLEATAADHARVVARGGLAKKTAPISSVTQQRCRCLVD